MILKHNFTSETGLKETLDYIYRQSKEEKVFHGILEVAFNEVTIITAIHNIKANKGARTAGIDRFKIDHYLQMRKEELIGLIQTQIKNYRPKPVKRVYIKKSNGKMRPLGIPTIIDRIIQECIRIVLEPIVEAKFYPQSYGFRPYRATKHAIKDMIHFMGIKSNHKPLIVIEGDIKGYFDNINHKILLKKLWDMGVHDKRIIAIIKKMLSAGYMESDSLYETETGTVQGGIISPLLANIYLNDFDWTVGRMYHHPRGHYKSENGHRKILIRKGIEPKYLIRYCDDWVFLTTTHKEAERMLKYLTKYFRHRLKLELSPDKTVITNTKEAVVNFLGFCIHAELPRKTPSRPNPQNIVGKTYPNPEKVKVKTKAIQQEVRKIRYLDQSKEQAIQIEKINAKIIGLAESYKSGSCSKAFSYIDRRVNKTAFYTFNSMYGKNFKRYVIRLNMLANRPERHKKYKTQTFAIKHEGMYIGITKAFITHSQWEKYPFNQNMTPYTTQGRNLYRMRADKTKPPPLSRPSLQDNINHIFNDDTELTNFEYYMNREYAFNRDKGKCKICGKRLTPTIWHCHHKDNQLPLNQVNKVPNLMWICRRCNEYIHKDLELKGLNNNIVKRILKFRQTLQ